MKPIAKIIAWIVVPSLLAGCNSLKPQSVTESPISKQLSEKPQVEITSPLETLDEQSSSDFSAETLFSLLAAEMAGYSEQYDLALAGYLQQAHKTQDAGIAQRATRIALFLSDHEATVDAAKLWSKLAPKNIEARQILALGLTKSGLFQDALMQMEAIQSLDGETSYDYLANQAKDLSAAQYVEFKKAFAQVSQKHPNNPQLLYGQAILQSYDEKSEVALEYADKALAANPSFVPAHAFKARLLHASQETNQALKHLKKTLKKLDKEEETDTKPLRTLYARLLINQKDYKGAKAQFTKLVEQSPSDPSLRLSLALTCIEAKDIEEAKSQLQQLTHLGATNASDAYYYLGRIAEDEGQLDDALAYYRKVNSGRDILSTKVRQAQIVAELQGLESARQELDTERQANPLLATDLYIIEAELLSNEEQYPVAMELLDTAIQKDPDSIKLLYSRAMIAEKLDNLESLERDLRHIIKLDPDNATALNALGYTLADRSQRYDEALELINRAYELKPSDPAIIDSLGWVHYRLGNLEKALELLENAFTTFPDPEVASHLVEVMWALGQQDSAETLLNDMLKEHPGNKLLLDAEKKLTGTP